MKRAVSRPILIILTALAFEQPTLAYLDPGSGSMMLQLLLGGIAGVGVVLKLYWYRLRDVLGFRSRDVNHDR